MTAKGASDRVRPGGESMPNKDRPKPNKHERKREDILQGALEYISRHGLEKTGLKEIAAHLGMTHPALYYYFKSKDEMVFEAVRRAMKHLIDDLVASQVGLPDNPELQLMTLCVAHMEHELVRDQEVSFVNAFIYGPLRNASAHSAENREDIRQMQRHVLALYRDCIRRGQETGVFVEGDATQLAFGVLGLVSYTVSWFRPDGKLSRGAAARNVAAQGLRSVKAEFGSRKI